VGDHLALGALASLPPAFVLLLTLASGVLSLAGRVLAIPRRVLAIPLAHLVFALAFLGLVLTLPLPLAFMHSRPFVRLPLRALVVRFELADLVPQLVRDLLEHVQRVHALELAERDHAVLEVLEDLHQAVVLRLDLTLTDVHVEPELPGLRLVHELLGFLMTPALVQALGFSDELVDVRLGLGDPLVLAVVGVDRGREQERGSARDGQRCP
jgi:hypothetical protein